jgi:hypothetical protein
MRKIFENAFTIGFVMSLAKPQSAKQRVTRMKGMRNLEGTTPPPSPPEGGVVVRFLDSVLTIVLFELII